MLHTVGELRASPDLFGFPAANATLQTNPRATPIRLAQ
jgi:hypothetical protein